MNPYNDDPQRYSLDGVAEPDPGGDYILWSDAEQMLDRIAELERLSPREMNKTLTIDEAMTFGWTAIHRRVLVVGRLRVEGKWKAYVVPVPGKNHDDEAKLWREHGSALTADQAVVFFPRMSKDDYAR